MKKNYLTRESFGKYAEGLKTVIPAFAPRQSVFFMPMAWMRAENIQYQPKHCITAFSESTPLLILNGEFLKKVIQMTNTIINTTESTLQQLYGFYQSMRHNWYKGNYTYEQEEVYLAVYNALEKALRKLPIQTEADKKIKLKYLKDVIGVTIEDADFNYDFSYGYGYEEEAFDLIDQLAAE